MLRALVVGLALSSVFVLPAHAEGRYDIYVLTFGPGDHPFARFGHTALWVRDHEQGRDVVYNYGTFYFDSPLLLIDFLQGRFQYWLSRARLAATLDAYAYEDRSIVAQELDLPAAAREALVQRLEENARRENRYYKFDYFFDNCSTRVRDMVDTASGGTLRRMGATPASMSHRDHALRLAESPLWEYVGLDLGLGPLVDVPRDRYAEAYVPEELRKLLQEARVVTDAGERPLVKRELVLHTPTSRVPPPERPLCRWPYFLGVGVLVGAAMLALRRARPRGFGAALALWGLVAGLLGTVLTLLWAFTDHAVAYRNTNVLLFPPWALVFVAYGVRLARGRAQRDERAYRLALVTLGVACLSIVTTAVWFLECPRLLLFALPVWAGVAVGLYLGARRAKTLDAGPASQHHEEAARRPHKARALRRR